jgi:hypothetical protein
LNFLVELIAIIIAIIMQYKLHSLLGFAGKLFLDFLSKLFVGAK